MSIELVSDVSLGSSSARVGSRLNRLTRHRVGRLTPGQLFAVMLAISLISIPTVWMVFASFKTREEMYRLPLQIFPSSASTTNYQRALKQVPFPRLFLNSMATTLIATLVKVISVRQPRTRWFFFGFPVGGSPSGLWSDP